MKNMNENTEDFREIPDAGSDSKGNQDKEINPSEKAKDSNDKENEFEKICYVCRRPESKAGKMIDMPGGISVCTDCLQKSFNSFHNMGMNMQMNISKEELEELLNMPGVHMM